METWSLTGSFLSQALLVTTHPAWIECPHNFSINCVTVHRSCPPRVSPPERCPVQPKLTSTSTPPPLNLWSLFLLLSLNLLSCRAANQPVNPTSSNLSQQLRNQASSVHQRPERTEGNGWETVRLTSAKKTKLLSVSDPLRETPDFLAPVQG